MEQRGLTEVELRAMLEEADAHRPSPVEGRFVIDATRGQESWTIIVEPDYEDRVLVVVTAYPQTS